MAEVVEYRLEKGIDELNLLVEFGLFSDKQAKEIFAKRQNFEYILRRRNKSKLDILKYVRFEVNLLESIEKYRKEVIKKHYKPEENEDMNDLDRQILLLQAKKLADIVYSCSLHVSSLFRKLTTSFQFDSQLWLAYIEFAKSRNWTNRTSALYWKLLRFHSDDYKIWLATATHELDANKAYDTARGLYLRALRRFPKCPEVWADYFKMEVRFMDIVDRRSRIVFNLSKDDDKNEAEDIWVDADTELKEPTEEADDQKDTSAAKEEVAHEILPIQDDDSIITGYLPKVVYKNATVAIDARDKYHIFLINILNYLLTLESHSSGIKTLNEHICKDIQNRQSESDHRISDELSNSCESIENLKKYVSSEINRLKEDFEDHRASKRMKKDEDEDIVATYERYEAKCVDDARKLFECFEKKK